MPTAAIRLPRFRRARAPERKLERRDAILDVAEERVLREPYAAIRMEDVALRLGLTKGTLYLYFPTKEALFLAVMRRGFARFFARAGAALAAGRATHEEAADALLGALAASPALPHLASVLHTVLEHNVADAEIAAFKHFLREEVLALGARIDRALRWPAGSGAQLLLRFHVLLIGLHHVSTPSRGVARALADDALALFRIDFSTELARMLRQVMQPLA
jgi:AcrR family transcriptional regulator